MYKRYHNLYKYFILCVIITTLIIPALAAPACSFCEFINISKGDKGDPGLNGTDGYTPIFGVDYFNGTNGATGPAGADGTNGTSATITINATFTSLPGTMASVINIGNATNAALDFTIPQGYNGSTSSYTSIGGLDTQVIYNNNNMPNGSPCLTFNYTTLTLSACNISGDGTFITNVTASAIALSFDVREGGVGNIYKGQAVYISGSTGVNVRVLPADNTITDKSRVAGLMVQDVTINGAGQVRRAGELTGVDTRPTNANVNPLGQTWAAGDLLFATTGGGLTNVRPTSGRSVKVAYSLRGSHLSDTLLAYPLENPVWITAATTEDVVTRLGDNAGVNKLSIRNYSNGEVAFINSYGNASFNGIDNNLYRLTNVRDPVALQDAATRNYVNTVNTTMKAYVDAKPSGSVNDSYDTVANVSTYVLNVNNSMRNNVSEYVIAVNDSMRNNVSQYVISVNSSMKAYVDSKGAVNDSYDTVANVSTYVLNVNNSMNNNVSQYVIAVNDSMRNNVSQYVISVNSSMKAYVDSKGAVNDSYDTVANVSQYITAVNNSMNNNVSQYVIAVNTSMRNNVSHAIATTTNLSAVYPIGSVYITTSSADPSTIFGGFGTWNNLGNGYVLVGV